MGHGECCSLPGPKIQNSGPRHLGTFVVSLPFGRVRLGLGQPDDNTTLLG